MIEINQETNNLFVTDSEQNNAAITWKLTKRLTPQSGLTSSAEAMNSFPYFAKNCFRTSMSSGMSAHLGDANTTPATASLKSMGQLLNPIYTLGKQKICNRVQTA